MARKLPPPGYGNAGIPARLSAKHERPVERTASHSHAVYGVVNIAVKFRGRFNALKPMSNRSYAEINFHITWHTKDNFPFIDSKLEPELWAFIKDRIVKMPNVFFHAIGGIQDHIHLASSFYPPFEIDRWIGEIKGASSHEFGKSLQWQSGYGVVTFGTRDLEWVVGYVRNQKERHRSGRLSERLERIEKK